MAGRTILVQQTVPHRISVSAEVHGGVLVNKAASMDGKGFSGHVECSTGFVAIDRLELRENMFS